MAGRQGSGALVVALFGLGCGGVGEPFYIDFREMQPRLHMEPRVRAEPRARMGPRVHVVAAEGESVCVLAGRYGVAAPALLRANGLTASDRALARGTQVRLPPEPLRHRIAQGETLADLARWYGLPVTRLARANGISDPDRIDADHEFATSSQRLLEPHAGGAEADRLRAHAFWISGLVYTGLGRTESAVTAFRTALELVPSLADQEAMSPKVRTLVEFARVASVAGPP